mmetsp:Transcript_1791/g.4583  ORF Transcript_1791/g.4583 Transcript_1791/m.4583 type:complete len:361 (+) Transcript_1791:167-1249(+)
MQTANLAGKAVRCAVTRQLEQRGWVAKRRADWRRSSRLRGLLEEVLRERVQQHAEDGERRADLVHPRHRRAEDDDGREDDHNALDGVADRVRDRVHVVQAEEGDLVVQVVGEARDEARVDEVLGGVASRKCRVPACLELGGALGDERDGGEADDRHDGEHRVQIGRAHVLTLGLLHRHLGEDRAQREGGVREHRRAEREPAEAQLGERRDGHTADDGHEREVHGDGEEGLEEDGRHHGGEERLGGLDDVRERNRARAERDHRRQVADRVHARDRCERLHLLRGELGCWPHGRPERQQVQQADGELEHSHGVREGEGVEDLLVGDVVDDVERIPHGEEHANLERLHQAAARVIRRCRRRGI